MPSYIYIGTKQSDLDTRDTFFSHSIVYYGAPRTNSSVYSQKIRRDNHYERPFVDFVIQEMKAQINSDPSCKFIFYANKLAWRILQIDETLRPFIACLNPLGLLNAIDSKIIFRAWQYTKERTSPYKVMTKQEIGDIALSPRISYVVQKDISAGGEGTYLWNLESRDRVYSQLSPQLYLVAKFIDGISISCTIICYEEQAIIFPANVQEVSADETTGYRFLFEGSNFVKGSKLSQGIQREVRRQARTIAQELSHMGYRGICGIDFMWHNKTLFAMEINPRFLGSSFLIDTALADRNFPSLACLHVSAFYGMSLPNAVIQELENIEIPYYSQVVTNRGCNTANYAKAVLESRNESTTVFMDGFKMENLHMSEPDAYLFRIRGKGERHASGSLNTNKG